jgi:predicted transcriptional regulator
MNIGLSSQNHGGVKASVKPGGINRRRSDIKIIADMLRAGEKGAGKTEIMYSANLSYAQIQKYLDYLVNQGFIDKVTMDNTLVAYRVTETGLKLLRAIDNLIAMLEPTEIL